MRPTTMLQVMSLAIAMLQLMSLTKAQSVLAPCSDNSVLPLYVDNHCTDLVCCKESGDKVSVTFNFTTNQPATSLRTHINVVFNTDIYRPVELPPPEPNACADLEGASCPLEVNQTISYTANYVIPTFPQSVVGLVEFRILDENNNTQTCAVQVVEVMAPGLTCG